jgi:hypothetical protein
LAPASDSRRATARPMPEPAPVTTAVRPASEISSVSGVVDRSGAAAMGLLRRVLTVGPVVG